MSIGPAFHVLLKGGVVSRMLQNVTFVLNDSLVFQSGMSFSPFLSGHPSRPSSGYFTMAKESQAFCK